MVISVPLVASILISFFAINYDNVQNFYSVPIFILLLSVAIFFIERRFFQESLIAQQTSVALQGRDLFVVQLYICVIGLFCFLDAYFHGVVVFSKHEGLYAQFTPLERHIRHISMLVWTFVPISFFVSSKKMKIALIVFAILALSVFLDRGRLMLMFASAILTLLVVKGVAQFQAKKLLSLALILILLAVGSFSLLGKFRAGADDARLIESVFLKTAYRPIGNECNLPEAIPFREFYLGAGIRTQWVLAYVAIPIFNLSTQAVCNNTDESALWRQIVPKWIYEFKTKYIILVSHKQNVATEFLPFYLSMQYFGIALALFMVFLSIHFAIKYYLKRNTIFSFLIVIKLLATAVFLNFAPQFFVWTNFGFIILFYCMDQFSTSRMADYLYCFLSRRLKT